MLKTKGVFFTVMSAAIFGLTPVYMKIASGLGLNIITFVILRSLLSIVIIAVTGELVHIKLILKGNALKEVVIACSAGSGLTSVLLSMSYNYISSGIATSLHFIYPTIVVVCCMIFFKERISIVKFIALVLNIFAIVMFLGNASSTQFTGMFLAVCSGCTYAFYIIYMSRTSVKELPALVLAFYTNIACLISSFLYGAFTNSFDFSGIKLQVMLIIMITTPLYSLVAVPFFQLGIRYIGPTAASLLSMIEPVTSIVCGALILKETLDTSKILGCSAIVLSVALTVLGRQKNNRQSEKTANS